MSTRAVVQDDWPMGGIQFALVEQAEDGTRFVHQFDRRMTRVEEATVRDSSAFVHLSDDAGRALYEALARHYGEYPSNPADLRKDYLAERARVDKLIDAAIERRL